MKKHEIKNTEQSFFREKVESPKKSNKRIKKLFASLFILALALALIFFLSTSDSVREFFADRYAPQTTPTSETSLDENLTPTQIPSLNAEATIAFAGDITMHDSLIEGGLTETGSYEYLYIFAKIKDIIQSFDYSIANYEGVLTGAPYSGWPYFNAPDSIATAIAEAGFDMVTTANNHSYDRAITGLTRTPEVFKSQNVKVIGTRPLSTDPNFEIVDINGIKFGFTAYTYETEGEENRRALNAILMMEGAYELVDSFNPYREERFEQDKKDMVQRATDMKNAGAECLVFVMHWGDPNHTQSNYWQKEIAQLLANEEVDIIFGTHPQVIQEISVVNSQNSQSSTLVYYSTGNFVSNMGYSDGDTNENGKVEDGIVARVDVSRDSNGIVSVKRGEYLPIYVLKDDFEGKRTHTIIPVDFALSDPTSYNVSEFTNLIESSKDRTTDFLSDSNGTFNGIIIDKMKP